MMKKECTRCKETKSLELFYKRPNVPDGRGSWCKKCCEALYMEKRYPKLKNNEKYKARHRKSVAAYTKNNPDKVLAHRLARSVKLADKCAMCENKAVHRHHPDYSKPLDVVSLCVTCHESVHHYGAKL